MRNATVQIARRAYHSVRPPYSGRVPTGCAFAPLQRTEKIAFCHPLDDEQDYLRFLKKDLPNYCLTEVPNHRGLTNIMEQLFSHNVPNFNVCWMIGPELIYRSVIPKEKQTDEWFLKTRLLRACVELKFCAAGVLDDIMDSADTRNRKPSWYLVAPKGMPDALCGGLLLHHFPHSIVKNHFGNHPFNKQMYESVVSTDLGELLGCVLDVHGQGESKDGTVEDSAFINEMKAGSYFRLQGLLGTLNVGINDPELISKVDAFFREMGTIFQIWDDFTDYYSTPEQTGKPGCDFMNGCTTWPSCTAQALFNEEQKKQFMECYGSSDPVKIERAKQLYDEVDLPRHYITYMKERHDIAASVVKSIEHQGLREACQSYLEWMTGDVVEVCKRDSIYII